MNKENTVYLENVLSVFDGLSCGQVALQRAGIEVDCYLASEIDKYAIKVATKNYPNTVELGTIENWREWDLPKIDLFIGGSPCQGFSNAGLGLNFDDPRSKLFFTYVDILNDLREKNPKLLFLLENVKMKKEWRDIITGLMGVEPIEINSALVSAQNRKRLYWTNIPDVQQPEDRGIVLADIIEDGITDRQKDFCLDANYAKGGNPKSYFGSGRRQLIFQRGRGNNKGGIRAVDGKVPSISTSSWEHNNFLVTGAAIRNQVTKNGAEEQLNIRKDDKSNCLVPSYPNKLNGMVQVGVADDINGYDIVKRIYSAIGKSPTLTNMQGGQRQPKIALDEISYRRLTVVECERLQTLEDNFTEGVSNSQRYKMIGNGFTVEVIAHIFRNIPAEL